ncbi:hypothetical protein [Clostridium sp. 1xD42-85]|uniref:hypothetical protein n=1 Tax=Clostridium sp. 1xD42-85 TaxID=2320084 RepID=UPI001A9B4B1A|nr:hypothetical protein [Clostridium sp. 1xD42-85]
MSNCVRKFKNAGDIMQRTAFIENEKNKQELQEELNALEIQVLRMQENVKEIAKKAYIVSIDQTKEANWVIVYANRKANTFQLMLHECTKPFRGNWDSAIEAEYKSETTIHISDIKGEQNKGFGSVLMKHLKEIAHQENKHYITGDIVKRDFDHVERLKHFYTKHYFEISMDHNEQSGKIVWSPC